jgi:hypothetical protein
MAKKEENLNRTLMENIRDTIKSYGVTTALSKINIRKVWNGTDQYHLMISCRGLITQNLYIIYDLKETILVAKYHPESKHYNVGKKLVFNIVDPTFDICRVTEVIQDLKAVSDKYKDLCEGEK